MNMNAQAFTQYKKATYETASPEKLLIMLYDGAIRNIKNAQNAIANNDINLAHLQIMKTEEIIIELMSTLNMDYEISKSLFNLYEYFYQQLVQANIKKDVELLKQVESFFSELRDTWNEAMKKVKNVPSEDQPKVVADNPVLTINKPAPPTEMKKSINIQG